MMIEAKSHNDVAEATVGETFLKSLTLLEQVHRRLHDVVKDDLERAGERSLTGVQALLISVWTVSDGFRRILAGFSPFCSVSLDIF